jgi:hypothetical protein
MLSLLVSVVISPRVGIAGGLPGDLAKPVPM